MPSEPAAADAFALFPVAAALVADTPGFNRPELPSDPVLLARAFPEIRQRLALGPCRFRNCRHLGDLGCAMGTDWPRFSLYRQCLEEVEAIASVASRVGTTTRRRTSRRQTSQGLSRRGREDSDPDHP
jgi:ribosome biogenesis GTPase